MEGGRADATHDVLAVSTRSVTTFVHGQLHETLFTIATDSARVTGAFLKSDRGQDDGRNCI